MTTDDDPYRLASTAADAIRQQLGVHDVAVVLGSGWGAAAEALGTVESEMAIHELPGVEAPTVTGHDGRLLSVGVPTDRGEQHVLVAAGRSHLYEGHRPDTVVHLVRSAVLSGCEQVVLTNAAGSLRKEVGVGQVVVISDHLNLMGTNPMVGAAPPEQFGSRFVDLTDLYDPRLRASLRQHHPGLAEGVYAGLLGGSFETPAEIRMLATLGAHLVGMSTVLEAIAARHLGARVLGLSLVTNLAAGLQTAVDHLEVLEAGQSSTPALVGALRAAVQLTRA